MKEEILVCRDRDELALRAAERFVSAAGEAVRARGRFRVALAGGRTPRTLYRRLAEEPFFSSVPWQQTEVFWGDERWVPPDHPDSNYRMTYEILLSRVPIPASHVHPMPVTGEPGEAAAAYEREIRAVFRLPVEGGAVPRFDLILLGLGQDGHTASLFPGSPVLGDTTHLVAAPFVPALGAYRLTLTPSVLCAAAHLVFLVSGADKAAALRAVLRPGPRVDGRDATPPEKDDSRWPARLVRLRGGTVIWLVDRAAWHV